MKRRCLPLLLLALLLAPWAARGLTEEQVAFFQARTQEWEAVLGPHQLWDYRENAMFVALYDRMPGEYHGSYLPSDETWMIPRFFPGLPELVPYETALETAKMFLHSYDPLRISMNYLDSLAVGSQYFSYYRSQEGEQNARLWQLWYITFLENTEDGWTKWCSAYINAQNGQVMAIDLGLDRKGPDDEYEHVEFQPYY